jgi:hypothetical protein
MKILIKLLAILLIVCACSKKSEEDMLPVTLAQIDGQWILTNIEDGSSQSYLSEESCSKVIWGFSGGALTLIPNVHGTCYWANVYNRSSYTIKGNEIILATKMQDPLTGLFFTDTAKTSISGKIMTWTFKEIKLIFTKQ